MSPSPIPPPKDRPILASGLLTNPSAPEWSEGFRLVIFWSTAKCAWMRFSDAMPLVQADPFKVQGASPDIVTITEWQPYIVPASRAVALAEGRLPSQ